MRQTLLALHRWLLPRLFYPLLAATILAMSMYAIEIFTSGWRGPRLHLNLFLAWLPYLFSLWAMAVHERYPKMRWGLALPIFLWFIFVPNSPYLVTDFMYLTRLDYDLWFRIGIFTAFSLTGLVLAVDSTYNVQMVIQATVNAGFGWLVVAASIALSGLGVYMGRFLRWNSWDLFTRPLTVIQNTVASFFDSSTPEGALGFSVMFTAMLAVAYYVFLAIRRSPPMPEEIEAG